MAARFDATRALDRFTLPVRLESESDKLARINVGVHAGARLVLGLVSWDDTGHHQGWYVNFQEPFRRTKKGFQTMDLMLDMVVRPERTWKMKDEDEYDELVGRGLIGPEIAARVREGVAEVLSAIECGRAPFDEEWINWRPDPRWQTPRLPEGWDDITIALRANGC